MIPQQHGLRAVVSFIVPPKMGTELLKASRFLQLCWSENRWRGSSEGWS